MIYLLLPKIYQSLATKPSHLGGMNFGQSLLYETHKKSIPIFLMNGRISFKSLSVLEKKFSGFKIFYRSFRKFLHSQPFDKERFKELGARSVQVTGNIKLAQSTFIVDDSHAMNLKKNLKIDPVYSSQHYPSEEEQVLNAFTPLKSNTLLFFLFLRPVIPIDMKKHSKSYSPSSFHFLFAFRKRKSYSKHRYLSY